MNYHPDQPLDKLEKIIQACRNSFFPLNLPGEIVARHVHYEERSVVYQKYVREVFPYDMVEEIELVEGMKKRDERLKPLYDRYRMLHSENILFYNKDNDPIGWTFGETDDHVTFYMRNTGLLKAYQNKGIYTNFLKTYLEYLKEIGYEKVTSHHLGTNKAVLIPKLKLGFEICGMELHETFGPNLKLVYIFHSDRKAVYYRKYGDKRLGAFPVC